MTKKLLTTVALAGLTFAITPPAFSWGGRGHHTICESAIHLVQSKPLKDYLLSKAHVMGHLCNVPDTYWKSIDADLKKHGDPTHYLNPEIIGLATKNVPTDFKAIVTKHTGQENLDRRNKRIFSVPKEMGSLWWRADQLFRNAVTYGQKAASAKPPTNSKQEQDDSLPFNKNIYEMIVNMGLMGHFVADNAQPFHMTSDYDGYAASQGGIHSYYEEASVTFFGPDFQSKIVKKAKTLSKTTFMKNEKSVIERMKALGELSANDIKSVLKADPMIAPSSFKIERGLSMKSPAKRQPPEIGHQRFEKLIIEHMARATALLASLWDKAYIEAGQPEIQAYKSYKFPFTPDFIMPDYYDVEAEDKRIDQK